MGHLHMQRMITSLEEKNRLLERMQKYTSEQTQAITENDIKKLENLTAKKQKLIDRINSLDDEFGKAFDEFKKQHGVETVGDALKSDADNVSRLKECVEMTVSAIKRIKLMEEENRSKAKRLLNALGEKMKKINQGKKLNTAYRAPSDGTPSFFLDKKK